MSEPILRDDPIERALLGPADPEPIILRTTREPGFAHWTVTLSPTGLHCQRSGKGVAGELAWTSIGMVWPNPPSNQMTTAKILDVSGSTIATVYGEFERGGPVTMLPHLVALYRPDLFVELDGNWFGPGVCVRRESTLAEGAGLTDRGTLRRLLNAWQERHRGPTR